MPYITPDDIHNIRDFDTLLDFLREKLNWHIPEDVELEDIAYPWSPEDLDLDELTEERIPECQQLPSFPTNQSEFEIADSTQPWGIFFLQFDSELVRSGCQPAVVETRPSPLYLHHNRLSTFRLWSLCRHYRKLAACCAFDLLLGTR